MAIRRRLRRPARQLSQVAFLGAARVMSPACSAPGSAMIAVARCRPVSGMPSVSITGAALHAFCRGLLNRARASSAGPPAGGCDLRSTACLRRDASSSTFIDLPSHHDVEPAGRAQTTAMRSAVGPGATPSAEQQPHCASVVCDAHHAAGKICVFHPRDASACRLRLTEASCVWADASVRRELGNEGSCQAAIQNSE